MIIKISNKNLGTFEVIVDDDIEKEILNMKWRINSQNGGKFRVFVTKYLENYKSKTIYLHREILKASNNQVVDHINGNPLDNRKINLRLCTNSENIRNSKIRIDNTTGHKGVFYRKDRNKYAARINFNKKVIHLGHYLTKEEAANAYNKAALKYFKEFARLNNI